MSTPFHSSSNTTPDAPTGTSNVAIVTGASSGIGLEVTKRLAAKGYRVVANSRKITSAMTLQATADLKLVDGDIGLPETAQRVVATVGWYPRRRYTGYQASIACSTVRRMPVASCAACNAWRTTASP